MIVDAIFRKGKAHSNHGNHVVRIITDLVRLIRGHYAENIAIGIAADTGFYDQRLFELCDSLDIAGKIVRTPGRASCVTAAGNCRLHKLI